MYLRQRDNGNARRVLNDALERYPQHRELIALSAARAALVFDNENLGR